MKERESEEPQGEDEGQQRNPPNSLSVFPSSYSNTSCKVTPQLLTRLVARYTPHVIRRRSGAGNVQNRRRQQHPRQSTASFIGGAQPQKMTENSPS
ncbi:hypothetical protein NC651_021780 [Populus alba x Populus x berolinensis]|nr:hypothetical protein NC651_021780 [Populus alba x Populus x berolinensis]